MPSAKKLARVQQRERRFVLGVREVFCRERLDEAAVREHIDALRHMLHGTEFVPDEESCEAEASAQRGDEVEDFLLRDDVECARPALGAAFAR